MTTHNNGQLTNGDELKCFNQTTTHNFTNNQNYLWNETVPWKNSWTIEPTQQTFPWQNPWTIEPLKTYYIPKTITTTQMRNQVSKKPECFITVNKSRLKSYTSNKNVYMDNNTEFEIEIFNPSTEVFGILFKINGQYISTSKLVIYPGKRMLLDRFIEEKKKFKYTTYSVENSKETKEAIALNGNIEIEFYREVYYEQPTYNFLASSSTGYYNCNNPSTLAVGTNFTNTSSINTEFKSSNFNSDEVKIKKSFFNQKLSARSATPMDEEIETGIIGKGNDSKQDFTDVNMTFEYSYDTIIKYKILPLSQKPFEIRNLINYCTQCGTKLKQTYKFCPNCSTKIFST